MNRYSYDPNDDDCGLDDDDENDEDLKEKRARRINNRKKHKVREDIGPKLKPDKPSSPRIRIKYDDYDEDDEDDFHFFGGH